LHYSAGKEDSYDEVRCCGGDSPAGNKRPIKQRGWLLGSAGVIRLMRMEQCESDEEATHNGGQLTVSTAPVRCGFFHRHSRGCERRTEYGA
jgi:hypothetical protein